MTASGGSGRQQCRVLTRCRRLWLSAIAFAFQLSGDAIDGVEERLHAGLDAIGRDAAAAIDLARMLDLDRHFGLRILAHRNAVDVEIAAHDFDAGDSLDGVKQGVERAVAPPRLRR